MKKKKIAIIGTVGVPGKYGGFETLAHNLVIQLRNQFLISVYCSAVFYPKQERIKYWNGARLFYIPLKANGIQSILYDIISIIHACKFADTLLILGVSGGIILPFVRIFTNKKIIVNIDGLEWRRKKWSWPVQLFLKFSEMVCVKFSHIDITDNEAIQAYTATEYGTVSRYIAYGSDHTIKVPCTAFGIKKYPFLKRKYAFKVCRIEPENNVEMILNAFSKSSSLPLVIVGNWSHSEFAIRLKQKYQWQKNIVILDPIYDQNELDLLRGNASVYVHGHSAGGTNPSLVEAMFLGLPILAFDVNFNRCTTSENALFFKSETELLGLLSTTGQMKLEELGKEMKKVANKEYTWAWIATKYMNLFKAVEFTDHKLSAVSKYSVLSKKDMKKYAIQHLQSFTLKPYLSWI